MKYDEEVYEFLAKNYLTKEAIELAEKYNGIAEEFEDNNELYLALYAWGLHAQSMLYKLAAELIEQKVKSDKQGED